MILIFFIFNIELSIPEMRFAELKKFYVVIYKCKKSFIYYFNKNFLTELIEILDKIFNIYFICKLMLALSFTFHFQQLFHWFVLRVLSAALISFSWTHPLNPMMTDSQIFPIFALKESKSLFIDINLNQ